MKLITFATLKGGVGKTTTCFNISSILARQKKVLIIDLDPQMNLSLNCNVEVSSISKFNSTHLFKDDLEELTMDMVKKPFEEIDLYLIPSSLSLISTEVQITSQTAREQILQSTIENNINFFNIFDYVFIDVSPSMSLINQNAFFASDSIVLITDISSNAIQGVEQFISLWASIGAKLKKANNIKALIINNLDRKLGLSKSVLEYCQKDDILKNILIDDVIYRSAKILNTETNRKPINLLPNSSEQHRLYIDIIVKLRRKGVV